MQRTSAYLPNGLLAPADLVRSRRGGAARPVVPPDPVPFTEIDALADLDRAWTEWSTSLEEARPAA